MLKHLTEEERRIYYKEYERTHKEARKAARRRYYLKHKEKCIQKSTEWRQNNPEKYAKHARKARLKKEYKLSPEEYVGMYIGQNGNCYLCGIHKDILNIDHNHKTGHIRKLLCNNCNRALGYVKENPIILYKMIEYLKVPVSKEAE